eukprot:m.252901 g.252901  ORF g.252901 m.252901 type:complete len:312 (+) comp18018_c0_seq1:2-937(+)
MDMSVSAYFRRGASLVPLLCEELHKGSSGRLAVLGGSVEYTGAPFLAGMGAMRAGVDILHIITHPDAAVPIKALSPDLIVHPLLHPDPSEKVLKPILALLERVHAVLIGPGLGREPGALALVAKVAEHLHNAGKPVVLDADALMAVMENPAAFRGHPNVILTPNINELKRMCEAMGVPSGEPAAMAAGISEKLSGPDAPDGPVVVAKGASDIAVRGKTTVPVKQHGSPRRAGGQGDILSGILGAFAAWSTLPKAPGGGDNLLAGAAAACSINRRASAKAYELQGRGMLASDMLIHVAPSVDRFISEHSNDE